MLRQKSLFTTILILLAAIVAVRMVLPYFVLRYANKTLAEMKGYYGHVEDIDLALIRGAYQLHDIYIKKVDSIKGDTTEFFSAPVVDLSIEWKALFHGSIVGELDFEDPVLRLTRNKVEPSQIVRDSTGFKQLLRDFMPLKVNRFEIRNGDVMYVDQTTKPKVDIALTHLHAVAHNLKNSYDSTNLVPASITANAEVYDGTFDLHIKLNPLAETPTFDLNAELKNTDLAKLNEFFQAYAKVDVNRGTFGMYTEVAARDGRFEGYVKPLITNLDVVGKEDRKDNILRKLWEGIVGTFAEVFQNQPKGQLATKVPIRGRTDDPKADILSTILNTLQNAFILALQPTIDHEISIATVDPEKQKESAFRKIFGNKKKNKASKKKEGTG